MSVAARCRGRFRRGVAGWVAVAGLMVIGSAPHSCAAAAAGDTARAGGAQAVADTAIVLDQAPAGMQKGYYPEDGDTVRVNPPPFIWVPVSDDARYVFEVSRTSDFSRRTERITDVRLNTVALPVRLDPGPWYWRYGIVQRGGKTLWSRTRGFTVPADAPVFRYPDVSNALHKVPKARPRLFLPSQKLDAYRERVASGDLSYVAEATKALDSAIGEALVPEPPPVTGEGAERGKNYANIIRETRPPMDKMEQFALSYLLTGNKAHGQEAKRRILHFFSWAPDGTTAYRNNDEPAMWVMMRGVRAYDWTADLFSAKERKTAEAAMRTRAAQFYDHLRNRRKFHTDPYESHAGRTLGFLGEAALAFMYEWPEAREWFDYVLTLYWNVYPAWGAEDGGWHEGPGYYTSYMDFGLHFVVALREAAGINLIEKPFFRNTPYYLIYTNPPYAKISPFGDGEHNPAGAGQGRVMYWFSTLLRDPYCRWYAEQRDACRGTDVMSVVLKDDTIVARPPASLAQARDFPGVGLVSLHTRLGDPAEDVHFLIHSDPYGAISHAHADQNAFTLEAHGEALAIASGYYPWYGSGHHRLWQWESKSSNTITFDGGTGQVIRSAASKGAITAFTSSPDYDYVEADATAAYQGRLTRCVRKAVHVRPGVFVLFDDVAAPAPVTFEWRLHALSRMTLDEPLQRLTLAQGKSRALLRLFYESNLKFSQSGGFDVPPERGGADQWHFVAATPTKTRKLQLVTVIMPCKAGGENDLPTVASSTSPTGIAIRLEDRQGLHIVAFRTDPAAAKWGVEVWDCDGEVFAFHLKANSSVDKTFVHKGTRVVETTPDGRSRTFTAPAPVLLK